MHVSTLFFVKWKCQIQNLAYGILIHNKLTSHLQEISKHYSEIGFIIVFSIVFKLYRVDSSPTQRCIDDGDHGNRSRHAGDGVGNDIWRGWK